MPRKTSKSTQKQQGGCSTVRDNEADVETQPQKTVEVVPQAPVQEGGKKQPAKKRTFKIKLNENEFCSRITGHTPKQAASKALTLIVNQKKQSGKTVRGKVIFTIKETTRGSKGKEYVYQGEKVKLKQPTTYKIRSPSGETKEIINKFRNMIEKYTQAE